MQTKFGGKALDIFKVKSVDMYAQNIKKGLVFDGFA